MKPLVIVLLSAILVFQAVGIAQTTPYDCNEKPGSSRKLFVFVGELLRTNALPAGAGYDQTGVIASYRIIDRICGYYPAVDTINVEVNMGFHNVAFTNNKYQMLMLAKDTAQGKDYNLWMNLYFGVLRTADGNWAVCHNSRNEEKYAGQAVLKPQKTKFHRNAFFDTHGLTQEAIDINFPEPYYRIEKNKAIPLFGNSIAEVFQHQKNGILADEDMFDSPELPDELKPVDVVVADVEWKEYTKEENDSIQKAYLAIKDSLLLNPFNEEAIKLLVQNCRSSDDMDNCSKYFDELIRKHPDSVQSYILKAKFLHPRATFEDSTLIAIMQQAVEVDSLNYQANYVLSFSYYRFFLEQPNSFYAKSALKYFIACINIDSSRFEFFKYALIQLSNYLNDPITAKYYSGLSGSVNASLNKINPTNTEGSYIPIGVFLRDTTNWVNNFKLNLVNKLIYLKRHVDGLSETLSFFNEPSLTANHNNPAYRFLWFRSFNEPVIIRMEKTGRQVNLYWKTVRYDDSLKTYQPVIAMKKKIRLNQWKRFEKLLHSIDYWNMVTQDPSEIGADGAIWSLEGFVDHKYQFTERWSDNYPKYTRCLRYLIELTDMEISEDQIY